ncbi:MAG: signal recognition particle protein Srp19, partial [Candidatus Woesearchaeota archaeon]
GSGKTTTSGKLARFFQTRGKKVALVGLDIHRPAAMDQIEQIAKQANVQVFIDKKEKNALKIWKNNEKELSKYDVVIIDTAGRDALSDDLIEEIETLTKEIAPEEKLLVISADIGQAAQKQAEQFHKSCSITGIVATKMDGTARGGGALSACSVTKAPIKFIGVGEKIADIEQFNPEGFVGRLLGMGDLEALLEKAKGAITEEEAEDLGKRFLKGDFSLIDLYEQMAAMKKMGSLSKIMEMVPGMGQLKIPKEALQVQEGKLEKWKHIMGSMTKEELEEPDEVMDSSRIDRVCKGSGQSATEVRGMLKQYKQSKKMVKMLKGDERNMQKMMKKMQGGQYR